MEFVVLVTLEVERQVEGVDQLLFEEPWLGAYEPRYECVLGHPSGEGCFTLPTKRSPGAGANAAKFDPEFVGEENA